MRKSEESLKTPSLPSYFVLPLVAVGITVLFVFLISVLVSVEAVSPGAAVYAVSAAVFVPVLFFSVLTARRFGKALVSALIFGLVYILVLYLLGMVLFGRIIPTSVSPLPVIACIAGSVSGSILSAAVKKRH